MLCRAAFLTEAPRCPGRSGAWFTLACSQPRSGSKVATPMLAVSIRAPISSLATSRSSSALRSSSTAMWRRLRPSSGSARTRASSRLRRPLGRVMVPMRSVAVGSARRCGDGACQPSSACSSTWASCSDIKVPPARASKAVLVRTTVPSSSNTSMPTGHSSNHRLSSSCARRPSWRAWCSAVESCRSNNHSARPSAACTVRATMLSQCSWPWSSSNRRLALATSECTAFSAGNQ